MLLPIAILSLAVVGLCLSLRGRRVDNHPLCRRCGFDLTHRSRDSVHCPECGNEVLRFGAIRIGRRHRSPALIAASSAALLLSLAWTALFTLQNSSPARFARYKPVAWLVWDARHDFDRPAALAELLNRLRAGSLQRRDLNVLIDHALKLQADSNITWDPQWGDFIEAAHAAGAVTTAEWATYARQSFSLRLLPADPTGLHPSVAFPLLPIAQGTNIQTVLRVSSRVGRNSPLSIACAGALVDGDRSILGSIAGNPITPLAPQFPQSRSWTVRVPIELVTHPGLRESQAVFDVTVEDTRLSGPRAAITMVRHAIPFRWSVPDGLHRRFAAIPPTTRPVSPPAGNGTS